MTLLEFTLVQKAKKSGGDKYTCISDDTFVIYVPQNISRVNGEPKQTITMTIE